MEKEITNSTVPALPGFISDILKSPETWKWITPLLASEIANSIKNPESAKALLPFLHIAQDALADLIGKLNAKTA